MHWLRHLANPQLPGNAVVQGQAADKHRNICPEKAFPLLPYLHRLSYQNDQRGQGVLDILLFSQSHWLLQELSKCHFPGAIQGFPSHRA